MADEINITVTEQPIAVTQAVTQSPVSVAIAIVETPVAVGVSVDDNVTSVAIAIVETPVAVNITATQGIEEAPLDGETYGRKDGDWTPVTVTETDPIFAASEAALFETGDKAKLDGIEPGAQVNDPETDPVFAASQAANVTGQHVTDLNSVTAFLRTILDDPSAAAVLTTLGITAKLQTLLLETNIKGTFLNDALTDHANPDMGHVQTSNVSGYYSDAITDKTLSNVRILGNVLTQAGAVRTTSSGTFQIYLNSRWNDVVINFVLRENSTFGYAFEHQPVGFTNYIEIMSGNSLNNLGLNGKPLTQGYQTSMGAYPVDPILDGGSF